MIEGAQVVRDTPWGVPGQARHYERVYITKCPLHDPPCFLPMKRKRRGVGTKECTVSGLGDYEPYAYFGAWIRCGQGMTPEKHCAFKPSRLQVQQYAREQGWVVSAGPTSEERC